MHEVFSNLAAAEMYSCAIRGEENLLYRRSCPYDAMGDYSLLIEKQQMKSTESEAHPFPAKSKEEPIRQ